MNQFDLLIKNGMVYTAVDSFEADIAVKDGKIIALGQIWAMPSGSSMLKECWSFPVESTPTAILNRSRQPGS